MRQVYVVSERTYKKAYHIDPEAVEGIIKVFDDYHKVVMYIRNRIREDHEWLDTSGKDLTRWHKCQSNPDRFEDGLFIKSIEYDTDNYYESKSYRFRSYDVE